MPAAKRPEPIRQSFRRISDATKRKMAELQRKRDARATELGIDPTLIASRATMLDLAEDWSQHEGELMEWQRELLEERRASAYDLEGESFEVFGFGDRRNDRMIG